MGTRHHALKYCGVNVAPMDPAPVMSRDRVIESPGGRGANSRTPSWAILLTPPIRADGCSGLVSMTRVWPSGTSNGTVMMLPGTPTWASVAGPVTVQVRYAGSSPSFLSLAASSPSPGLIFRWVPLKNGTPAPVIHALGATGSPSQNGDSATRVMP